MKFWTGDEWRSLSPNEANYRRDCGAVVVEDDAEMAVLETGEVLLESELLARMQAEADAKPRSKAPKKER